MTRAWSGLAVMLLAAFMDVVDSTIVGVALPGIQRTLGADGAELQWIDAAYPLAFALVLITGGRLGDLRGRRPVFLAGVAGFTAASALSGLATTPEVLVAGRVLQGVAAAVMVPQVLGHLRAAFPPRARGAAFGLYGAVLALAAVSGPLLGGLLTGADLFGLGWRAIFLVNVPIGVLTLAAGLLLLPRPPARAGPTALDLTGVVLLAAALLALLYPLVQGREHGGTWWLACAVAPLLVVFRAHERRVTAGGGAPLVRPGLLADRAVSVGLLVGLVFSAGGKFGFVLSVHLQTGLGADPSEVGVAFVPFAVGVVAGSVTRAGPRRSPEHTAIRTGMAVMIGGLVATTLTVRWWGPDLHAWQLAPGLLLAGAGLAVVTAALVDLVLGAVPEHEAGSVSGLVNTSFQLGTAIGIAVVGSVFYAVVGNAVTTAADHRAHNLPTSWSTRPEAAAAVRCLAAEHAEAATTGTRPSRCTIPADPEIRRLAEDAAADAVRHGFARATERGLWATTGILVLGLAAAGALPSRRPRIRSGAAAR
ncbi:MFS transporter [Saccharothrix xinjiangensis]|uniref:MFS transporter n=1 Tax=Saccharothrix xinjiangensis TaxID=204798 RepID=A0ABV9Y019_9PSEU